VTRHTVPALALAATLLVAGCSGDDPAATPSSTPPPSSTSAGATSPSETAFTGTEIVVELRDGKAFPPTHRVKITKDSAVRLLVTSDVDDELHVHGYDLMKDLPAGQQEFLDLTADQAGVFEVEAEESGIQLAQLEVR